LALSILEGARAGEELGAFPFNEHPLAEGEEPATLILEQEDKIREILGNLWLKLHRGNPNPYLGAWGNLIV
jgi:hypothetical protein